MDDREEFSKKFPDDSAIRELLESGEAVEAEHPDAVEASDWLKRGGLKGWWTANIGLAEMFSLPVDEHHRRVVKLLPHTVGGESERQIESYLLHRHGIIPGDAISVERLADLLRQDLAGATNSGVDGGKESAKSQKKQKRGRPKSTSVQERNREIQRYLQANPAVGPSDAARVLSEKLGEPVTVDMVRNVKKSRKPGKK